MRQRGALLRTAAVLVTAGLTGWVAATASAGTSAGDAGQRFYADSGGSCLRDYSDGGIWPERLRGLNVGITGVIVDRPLPDAPGPCPDDGSSTTATFTAYAGGVVVDVKTQQADNEQREFSFDLLASRRIDVIVVRVCRVPPSPTPTDYCGAPQKYLIG